MKRLFFLLLSICIFSCAAPKKAYDVENGLPGVKTSYNWKRATLGAGLCAVSGASWGLHETLVHHYSRFDRRFPHANPGYWDPRESWRNKYEQGDPALGPDFTGSTTFLAWTTDAKHLAASIHRGTLFGSAVVITLGEYKPPWHYLLDAGICFVGFSLGFHGTYSLLFR